MADPERNTTSPLAETPAAKPRRRLPGDPADGGLRARLLRVDHAGEYGARRIYEGQLAVLGRGEHLRTFEGLLPARRVRPTLLQPVWHVAGFMLGAGTALLGERAAMACTVAVEEVIDEHYAKQVETIADDPAEAELTATLERFRADELAHRDIGLAHEAEQTPGYAALTGVIKAGSRLAIWLSERV
jgi:ubiquinone biosynthesis monooxygenase Coq7